MEQENEKNVAIVRKWWESPERSTITERAMFRCIEYLVMDGNLFYDNMRTDDIFGVILRKLNEVTDGK